MPTRRFKLTKQTKGRVNWDKVDATTEQDIQRHIAEYEAEADADAAAYAKAQAQKQSRRAMARQMPRDAATGRFISSKKTASGKKRLRA